MGGKGWKKIKIESSPIEILDGDRGSNYPKQDEFYDKEHCLFLNTSNVTTQGFNFDKTMFITREKDNLLRKGKLQRFDIILTTRGTVGNVAYYDESVPYQNIRINSGMIIFRNSRPQDISAKYFYQFLRSPLFRDQVLSHSSGSAQPQLPIKDLKQIELPLPPLHTQTRIAAILSALDDKIELNRQTNQTLEAIAQAIFKEWFVDFNFPHSPLEGWQAKPDGVDSSLRPCPTGAVDSLQAKPDSLPSWQKNSLFPFWTLPKNHKLQERAKELRKQGILSEVVFWKAFKDKKKLGWDIDRQVIIGNFIVDFFIPELGLVFEIDGSSHDDKQEYDQERDAFLSSLQLKVARISDKDVLRNIEGVWSFVTESIRDRVEELEDKNPPRPEELEDKNPPRPSGTPQEGNKYKDDGGEMQDSELGPIPKGWRVGKLGDVFDITMGQSPPGESYNEIGEGIPFFQGRSDFNFRFPTKRVFTTEPKRYAKKFDTLVSVRAPVGDMNIATENCCIGRGLSSVIHKRGCYSFTYYFLKELTAKFKGFEDNGTVFGSINKSEFESMACIIPNEGDIGTFENISRPIDDIIFNNEQQSAALAAIRDALLPKLMNGEINV